MSFLRNLFGMGPKVNCQELVNNGAILIDVRTPSEFNSGHVKGSTNVPLDQLQTKAKKIKQMNKPVVLCCQSGMRSAQATSILKRAGIEQVYNGGGWHKFA